MRTKLPLLILSVCMLVLLTGQTTHAQFAGMVKYIPGTANSIILLNAEKVLASDLAKKEGWQQNFEKAVEAGMVRLPADTQQYVLASQTDYQTMRPLWEVGVLKTAKPHSMKDVADKRKGTTDNISGQDVVLMPSGNYVVQFDHRTYGALMPASRQAVARWIRETGGGGASLSDYIKEAIGYSEKAKTEIIMAMDMTDAIDLELINERLKEFKSIPEGSTDTAKVAQALTSIRGVTLGITLGEKPFGKIKVDFSSDASVLDGIAGKLFLEILARNGAMIEDFEQWTAKVNGKQITFQGYFSPSGMRRVFSLIESPVSEAVAASDEPAAKNGASAAGQPGPDNGVGVSDEDVAYSTQKYFRSVSTLLDEFRHHDSPQRISQFALWFDKYARRIDRLPMVGVDKEMLDFGEYVSNQLGNAASAIRGIGMRSRVRTVNVDSSQGAGYYGNNYYNGGYAYNGTYYNGGRGGYGRAGMPANRVGAANNAMQAGLRNQQRAQTQIRTQEKVKGAGAARAIMEDVTNATQQVRRTMTEKYQIEF